MIRAGSRKLVEYASYLQLACSTVADIQEGDVLWIDSDTGGFPFRVLHLLGWADPFRRVAWVRGVALDRCGLPERYVTLRVPAAGRDVRHH